MAGSATTEDSSQGRLTVLSALARGMVRIIGKQGLTIGAGFVASQKLIVTCAHVVEAAGALPGETVQVAFLASESQPGESQTLSNFSKTPLLAQVRPDFFRSFKDGDIAILEIADPLPAGVMPLSLGATVCPDHSMETIGFPNLDAFRYFPAYGRILQRVPENERWRIPIETSQAVEGFSGAPVLDTNQGLVVGMLTTRLKPPPQAAGQLQHLTMAIPMSEVFVVCGDLQPSEKCPYKGLDTFSENDSSAFFGRDRALEQLMSALAVHPELLFVLGPSGSGKSSLLRAGVVPRLHSGQFQGGRSWEYIRRTPTDTSAQDLAQLSSAWRSVNDGCHRLLVLDQFEELFTRFDRSEQQNFVANLDRLLSEVRALTVIIAARDDYFSEISRLETLTLRAGQSGIVTVLRTLRRSEIEAVVVEPAKSVGVVIEPSLITALTMDAMRLAPSESIEAFEPRVDATILPLLESTLKLLWAARNGNVIRHSAYRDGGITDSISSWASNVYKALGTEHQEIARSIFLNLVDIDLEREVQTEIRRSIEKAELYRTERTKEDVDLVLNAFVAQRLIVTSRSDDLERVEIIHDVLIRQWVLLRTWIDEEKQFLLWRHEAQRSRQAWQKTNSLVAERDDGRLLRGRALEESEDWLRRRRSMISPELRRYVELGTQRREADDASRDAERAEKEQQRKDRERLRAWTLRSAVAASIIFFVIAAYAFYEWREAKAARTLAETNAAAIATFVQDHMAPEGTSMRQSHNAFTATDARKLGQLARNTFAAIPLSRDDRALAISRLKASDVLFKIYVSRSGSCSGRPSRALSDDCTHLFEKALETAKRELSDAKKYAANDPNDEEWPHYESQAEQHIGDMVQRQARTPADLINAQRQFESSIDYTKQLVAMDPDRFEFRQELAAAIADRGDALRGEHDLDGAVHDYRLLINTTDINWQRKVAITYGKIGDIVAEKGHLGEAQMAYQRNLAISEQLEKLAPSDDFERGVGIAYEKLGFIMRKENSLSKALADYREEIKIFRKLNSDRGNGVFRRDEALGYLGLGDVWSRLGNAQASMRAYSQYADRIESMSRDEPSDQRVRHDLAIGYERLGQTKHILGEGRAASAMFQNCVSVADRNWTFDSRNPEPRDVRAVCEASLAKVAMH